MPEAPADHFLRLACLTYTDPDPDHLRRAERLLAERPELATANVWTMAACGRACDLADLLADEPDLVHSEGGPHRWAPLVWLTYARLGVLRGDPVATARVLVAAGADVDAGFLWQALASPFTALTGALGGGERGEPVHPDAVALAEVLLRAGADPNDNQALYNRMSTADDSHLEVLLPHGLGAEVPSVWRGRLGNAYPSPAAMLGEQLRTAAERGYLDRVRLLLAHDVDPNTVGYHPLLGDRTAYEMAVRNGHREAAALLAAAGGRSERLDEVDGFVADCLAADREVVTASLALDDTLAGRAVARRPDLVLVAVEQHHDDALPLLMELGLDVDGPGRDGQTALHQAAYDGRDGTVDWLLAHGADRHRLDGDHRSTPAGWAAHAGHLALAARLDPVALDPGTLDPGTLYPGSARP
ncbi:MAG: ankyrin repeat domain-containing protein [Nocardioidaceae bacterium]